MMRKDRKGWTLLAEFSVPLPTERGPSPLAKGRMLPMPPATRPTPEREEVPREKREVLIDDEGGWRIPENPYVDLRGGYQLKYICRAEAQDSEGNPLPEVRIFELHFDGEPVDQVVILSEKSESFQRKDGTFWFTINDMGEAGVSIVIDDTTTAPEKGDPEPITESSSDIAIVIDAEPSTDGEQFVDFEDMVKASNMEALVKKAKESASLVLYGKIPGGIEFDTLWRSEGADEGLVCKVRDRSSRARPPHGVEHVIYGIMGESGEDVAGEGDSTAYIRYHVWVDQTDSVDRQFDMGYIIIADEDLMVEILEYVKANPADAFDFFNQIFSEYLSREEISYTADSEESRRGKLLVLDRDRLSDRDMERLRYHWYLYFDEDAIKYTSAAREAEPKQSDASGDS
jgi:hypothetical protein